VRDRRLVAVHPVSAGSSDDPRWTRPWSPEYREARRNELDPDRTHAGVGPREHQAQVTAVFDSGSTPVTSTVPGRIFHDVVLQAALPIGHTMIKGVTSWTVM